MEEPICGWIEKTDIHFIALCGLNYLGKSFCNNFLSTYLSSESEWQELRYLC